MTKMEVAAAIYSTAAGALVRYETDELAQEWARLEKLPLDQLGLKITREIVKEEITQERNLPQMSLPGLEDITNECCLIGF